MQMRYKYFPADWMYRWSVAKKRVKLEKELNLFRKTGYTGMSV